MNVFDNLLARFFDENKPRVWLNLILITFLLYNTISQASYDLKNGMPLQVHTSGSEYSSYHSFKMPDHNQFISGVSGELYWHPRSFIEALLLGTVSEHGGSDILDVVILCVFVAVFYYMTMGAGRKITFSRNLYYGFLLVFLLISVSGAIKGTAYYWMSDYIKKMTAGRFSLQLLHPSNSLYGPLGMMLFFMLQFPKQALDMQKEQELTI